MASDSHTSVREGWGTIWEMSKSVWVTGHKPPCLKQHFFPLFDVWWFTILEHSDSKGSFYSYSFFTLSFHWDIYAKQKSLGQINLNRSIILVITSAHLASTGTDYGSAHFLCMSQRVDGLHIKRFQACQWPFIKAGQRWHPIRKEKDLKWRDFPKA